MIEHSTIASQASLGHPSCSNGLMGHLELLIVWNDGVWLMPDSWTDTQTDRGTDRRDGWNIDVDALWSI